MAGGDARERTALIVTVLNEADTIDALLESISKQTHQPDEVVVVDGGSTDGTPERIRARTDLPIQLIDAPGANIARGRNLAIQATSAELIAVTDAGVRLDHDWLDKLVSGAANADVVAGFFAPEPRTVFERSMGATVLPAHDDVDPETFLPSSRSILFRRAAWAAVGGYPEWLDYCEDLVFDLALKRSGARFAFAPRAIARFWPRGTLGAFFRQYYLYARGDGKADLWRRRHAVRYLVYLVVPLLLRLGPLGLVVVLGGVVLYTRRPLRRLWPQLAGLSARQAAYAVILVPVIRLVGDVAKMVGYPVGVWWRARQ